MTDAIVNDGKRSLFASFREVAWHRLGTVFQNVVTDYSEMISLAGLGGWNVRVVPAEYMGYRFATPTFFILADIGDETVILGTSGKRYTPVQNEDAFAFLQSLQDGARWETAGAIENGTKIFGSMAFDRQFVLDPSGVSDTVESYLMLHKSHNGGGGGGGVTPVRVVCKNTLAAALPGLKQTFTIRHTKNVAERMALEAETWRNAHAYMDAFESEAQALFQKSVTDDQFFGLVKTLYPEPEENKKGALTKWENRIGMFAQAWQGEPNAGIRGTAWGAWNALTEANQWGRNMQSTDNGEENFFAAGAGFDAPTNNFRQTTLELVKAL